MRRLSQLVCITVVVVLVGCNPDGSDLNKTLAFYYNPGGQAPDGSKTYHLLSKRSQTEISKEAWINNRTKVIQVQVEKAAKRTKENLSKVEKSLEVLRQETQGQNTYAVVMLRDSWQEKEGVGWSAHTQTWVQEEGKWRRLFLPKTEEEANRAFASGDYPAAYAKAQNWLAADPYSIEAYNFLGFSIQRGGAPKTGGQTREDVVRAVLGINPKDELANFLATTWTKDPKVARTFLKRLEGSSSYSDAAANLSQDLPPRERLRFLDSIKPTPSILIQKVETYIELGPAFHEDCRQLMAQPGFEKEIVSFMSKYDASFIATNGGEMGLAALGIGDVPQAQRWLDLATGKDPNNYQVRRLAAALARH